jgi:hypothetical protein
MPQDPPPSEKWIRTEDMPGYGASRDRSLQLFQESRFEDARLVAEAFMKSIGRASDQLFSMEVGTDKLRCLGTSNPRALAFFDPAVVNQVRLDLAEHWLFGKRVSRRKVTLAVMQNLTVAANHAPMIERWRRSDVVGAVQIVGSGDGACEQCKALHGISYSLAEVPELPHSHCANILTTGCRCLMIPIMA